MRIKTLLLAGALAMAMALPGQAKSLKFAFQGSVNSLDPYNLNETFTLGFLGNIYEGLIRRGPGLEFEPALERPAPGRERAHRLSAGYGGGELKGVR